jgi:serine/threonine-protein kinase RsbW
MSLAHSVGLGVAARAVADVAAGLGLRPVERTQLDALMTEALAAVVADSFDGAAAIDVDVVVRHEPGVLEVVVHQRGAPSTYVNGQLPVRLETLLSLGYADSMQFLSDGVKGSELRIVRSVSTGALIDDATFVADTERADDDPSGLPSIDPDALVIRPIAVDDVIEVARLYFRTYGYTKIGSPWIYEPDVFRHRLESGLHEGVVAVAESGRVLGHTGLLRPAPDSASASGGPMAVDPALRQRGLAERMNAAFLPRLLALGLRGVFSEAVTAHPASQKAALRLGSREVGLILGRQPAELDFLGFDGPSGFRRAVMVLYLPLGSGAPVDVHVPPRYRDIVERIYGHGGLPREVHAEGRRPPADLPAESRLTTELTAATRFAQVNVLEYGADFVEALQGLMLRFEREQFEVITVRLPLDDPLTAYFGSGLGELGLSFNAVLPEQARGDEIVLGLSLTEQDPATIAVASDVGRELLDYVVADRERVIRARHTRARARTSMARILDAI